MYAVFRSGGKQYRAAKGDVLRVEKIDGDEGATVSFDEVLLVGEGSDVKVGSPIVDGSSVSAKVVRQGKSRKVPVVKFKRRQNYLRQGSHRQFFTEVEITGITASGARKAAPAKDEAADKPAEKKVAKKTAAKKPAKKKAAKKTAKKAAAKPSAHKAPAKKTTTNKADKKKAAKKSSD